MDLNSNGFELTTDLLKLLKTKQERWREPDTARTIQETLHKENARKREINSSVISDTIKGYFPKNYNCLLRHKTRRLWEGVNRLNQPQDFAGN